MRIAIIGGGNIGTLMAGEFAANGHEVNVFASKPEMWNDSIKVLDQQDRVLMEGRLATVSDDLRLCIKGADMIWITYPTFMLQSIADNLSSIVSPGQHIGVVPGNDAEFYFADHVREGVILFGLQRVHSIARLKKRGDSVYMLGRKPELQVAALPSSKTDEIAEEVEALFRVPTVSLPHYLVETLTPSNPILHTARIRSMFRHWEQGVYYDRNILFYEEWDDASSKLMLSCDDELQQICRALEQEMGIDLSGVKSLCEHYESPDAFALTAKISGIPAFRGLTSPMKEVSKGCWVPDFDSRYFKADFAFGLKAIRDIAKLVEVPTPAMDDVYSWYKRHMPDAIVFDAMPKTLGELKQLYRQ